MTINLDINLSHEQNVMREMIAKKIPFPLFVGGYGSGKSYSLVINVFETLFVRDPFPGCKIGVYSPTYDLIRLNLIPKFQEFFDVILKGKIAYTYNKNDKTIYLPEGRQIIFRSTDNPGSLVGYDHYEAHSDESDTQSIDKAQEVHKQIQGRNRQRHPLHGRGTKNVQADYTTPESYRFTYKFWGKDKPPGFIYVRAPTWSNTELPKQYIINKLHTYTPQQQKAYLKGEWTNLTTGSVYSCFDPERHHTNRVIRPGDVLHIGQDFNVGGCCGAVFVIDRQPEFRIHQVDEFADVTTEDVVETLQSRYEGHRCILYPDSTGGYGTSNASRSDIDILRQARYEIKADSPPRIEDRVNAVQRLFYRDLLYINRYTCPESWSARMEHAYSKMTGKPEKYRGPGTVDDRNDAGDYPLEKLFPIRSSLVVPRVAQ